MKPLTSGDIAKRLDELQEQVAHVIRALEASPARAYASATEPMTVNVREAATILGVKRDVVYQLHREGELNGFRPTPTAHLRFLLADVRHAAVRMAESRKNA